MWEPRDPQGCSREWAGAAATGVPAMRGEAESAQQPGRTLRPGLACTNSPFAKDSASHVPAEPALPPLPRLARPAASVLRVAPLPWPGAPSSAGKGKPSLLTAPVRRRISAGSGMYNITTRSAAVWKGKRLGTFHLKSSHHKEKMFRFLFTFLSWLLSSTRRWVLADAVWQPRHNTLCVNQTVTLCTSA